jgi:APA family basic amino acid/polyamine antiporter
MLVAGSMIGSGIFIVSAIIARQVGAPGWLLVVWIVTGLLTLTAALSYGELAAMMPKAGGQYVYLREAFSPLWGFLYGWTLFLVIQTGTIAAVAVGFARYMGVLVPWVSERNYLIAPLRLGGYAVSLSTAQLVGLALIGFLTFTNTRGLEVGKLIQNVFTTAKTGALIALIVLGIIVGLKSGAGAENFKDLWTIRGNLQEVGAGLMLPPRSVSLSGIWCPTSFLATEQHHIQRAKCGQPAPRRSHCVRMFLGLPLSAR